MKKKAFAAIAAASIMVSCIAGCGSLNIKPATLQGAMELPSDGVISADITAELIEQNGVMIFAGNSGDIKYEWTVFGSDMDTPHSLNLGTEFAESEKMLSIRRNSDESLGFSPVLSVYLNSRWEAYSAVVFNSEDGTAVGEPVCSASVTGSGNSILNFAMPESAGKNLVVLPDDEAVSGTSGYGETGSVNSSGNTSSAGNTNSGSTGGSGNSGNSGSAGSADNGSMSGPGNSGSAGSANSGSMGGSGNSGSAGSANSGSTGSPGNSGSSGSANNGSTGGSGNAVDPYLSKPESQSGNVGKESAVTDKYKTDPIPSGRPAPAEPETEIINKEKQYTCELSIECSSIFNNLDKLAPEKLDVLPSNGVILENMSVSFYEGESVWDLLERICREKGIHLEASWTPMYNSAYVEGICNLYEFDCGSLSGWMFSVNGWYPNYGCSRYSLSDGDVVRWRFTCDLGADIGADIFK